MPSDRSSNKACSTFLDRLGHNKLKLVVARRICMGLFIEVWFLCPTNDLFMGEAFFFSLGHDYQTHEVSQRVLHLSLMSRADFG